MKSYRKFVPSHLNIQGREEGKEKGNKRGGKKGRRKKERAIGSTVRTGNRRRPLFLPKRGRKRKKEKKKKKREGGGEARPIRSSCWASGRKEKGKKSRKGKEEGGHRGKGGS